MNALKNQSLIVFILLIIGLVIIMLGAIELLTFFNTKPSTPPVTESPATKTQINTVSFPRQIRDAIGNSLTIPAPPQRIVSQTLGSDEILLTLAPPSHLVAISTLSRNANYSNVVEKAQTIKGQVSDNVEHILSFNPDLIFVASYSRAETVELLQALGAPVFRLHRFQSIADINNNIQTIGYAIGEEERAAALIAQMEQDIKMIRANIPHGLPPRIISYTSDNYTAGSHTTFDDMVHIVGAINLATEQGIEQHVKINSEQILAWQPDFIITHAAPGEFAKVRVKILQMPAIAASDAGKKGQIIVIDNRHFMSVSHYIIYGIKALFEGLYLVND